MKILELIQKTTIYFEKAGVPNARLDMELILAQVLGLRRMDLYLQFERVLSGNELNQLRPLVKRRAEREPLQHILGHTDFCQLRLKVSPAALIPRPETEQLVQWIVECIPKDSPGVFLDVGTGSGALALAILHERLQCQAVATDLSEEALGLARVNAEGTGLEARIQFRQGDLFDPIPSGEKFDWIVSNPPYISREVLVSLQPEVRRDPVLALDGGPDGLEIVRKIISGAPDRLKPSGRLFLELGHDQDRKVSELLGQGGWRDIQVRSDLQGVRRFVSAVVS